MTIPETVNLPKFDGSGEPAGDVAAPGVFAIRPHAHAMYLAVTAQLSNARAGTSATKTKGEVSGGGKKPWRQKHTGRARQGSTRAPQWRHGGISFGPTPHKHGKDSSKSLRRLALRSVLAAKMQGGQVAVVVRPVLDPPKTKTAAALLRKVSAGGSVVFVVEGRDEGMSRAFRNIPSARVSSATDVSAYDILRASRVLVTAEALEALAKRCGTEGANAA